jgi:hypothetical protein
MIRQKRAATCLQCFVRGNQVRKSLQKHIFAAFQIQQTWFLYRKRQEALLTYQNLVQKRNLRQKQEITKAKTQLARCAKEAAQKAFFKIQNGAALRIQCFSRFSDSKYSSNVPTSSFTNPKKLSRGCFEKRMEAKVPKIDPNSTFLVLPQASHTRRPFASTNSPAVHPQEKRRIGASQESATAATGSTTAMGSTAAVAEKEEGKS